MKDQSRRCFCQLCLLAGAGLGSAALFATDSGPRAADELKPDDGKAKSGANGDLDYSLIGYCGYRCDICPGSSEDRNT
jgi:hypothetical protein